MAKEILLYSSIYSYTAADIITQMEAAKDDDMVLRVNGPGGEVYYTYGIVAKFQEHQKEKKVQVDGRADSCCAYLCCYADNVEALDISTFLFHRAAFPSWIENDDQRFTDDMKASLNQMNAQLRAAMEGKMREEDFKKVTDVSYDDLFSLDSRIDVVLDAKQAKKVGLVNKIVTITPEKKAEIEREVFAIAAHSVPAVPATATQQSTPQTKETMTLAEFKAQHPAVYAEAVKEGTTAERDRVEALMVYHDVDPEAVSKLIAEGGTLTQKASAELNRKALSKEKLGDLKADSTKEVKTGEAEDPKTAEAKAAEEFEAAVNKNLGKK